MGVESMAKRIRAGVRANKESRCKAGLEALREALNALDREDVAWSLIADELDAYSRKRRLHIAVRFMCGEKPKDIAKSVGLAYGSVIRIINKAFRDGDIQTYTCHWDPEAIDKANVGTFAHVPWWSTQDRSRTLRTVK